MKKYILGLVLCASPLFAMDNNGAKIYPAINMKMTRSLYGHLEEELAQTRKIAINLDILTGTYWALTTGAVLSGNLLAFAAAAPVAVILSGVRPGGNQWHAQRDVLRMYLNSKKS